MQALGRGLTTIPVGYLADRYRPRVLISAGSLLVGLGSLVSAVAPVFELLVLSGVITGAGTAFVFMAGMAYIVRSSSPRERGRAVGRTMAGWGLGMLLAPLAAGVLAKCAGMAQHIRAGGRAQRRRRGHRVDHRERGAAGPPLQRPSAPAPAPASLGIPAQRARGRRRQRPHLGHDEPRSTGSCCRSTAPRVSSSIPRAPVSG